LHKFRLKVETQKCGYVIYTIQKRNFLLWEYVVKKYDEQDALNALKWFIEEEEKEEGKKVVKKEIKYVNF
jgi:hypothetical protein